MKYFVLSAKTYDFENNQGERIKGSKVSYINKKATERDNEFGNPPLIVNTASDIDKDLLSQLPAICELNFEQVTGKNNKPELVLTDLELVTEIDLELIF